MQWTRHRVGTIAAAALIACAFAGADAAAAPQGVDTPQLCRRAIARAEAAHALPRNLLTAISLAESGRWNARRQAIVAWPWTVNNGGEGRFFPNKAAAIAFVRRLQRNGERNIDVGCLQVNLHYHGDEFADLEAAFDPAANARYAAEFLAGLHDRTKSWSEAVRRYHSADRRHSDPYRARVVKMWSRARQTSAEAYRQAVITEYRKRRAERRQARRLAQAGQ